MTARTLVIAALLLAGCKSRDATPPTTQRERPTTQRERPTIESLDPPRVCFPSRQPDNRGQPSAATFPTTTPTTQAAAHGAPGHWCQLCAAAAQRAAESGQRTAAVSADRNLLQDLPPR